VKLDYVNMLNVVLEVQDAWFDHLNIKKAVSTLTLEMHRFFSVEDPGNIAGRKQVVEAVEKIPRNPPNSKGGLERNGLGDNILVEVPVS